MLAGLQARMRRDNLSGKPSKCGRSSVGRALQREGILLLNTLGRWFESNRPVYQVNMRMNIATCFNKILLEIERKLKGIYDQEGNRQVCGR